MKTIFLIYVKVLVFNVIYNSFIVVPTNSTVCYVLIIDRNASSLYEVGCVIKKYLTPNLVHYVIQQKSFSRRFVPDELLEKINNLFSINFGTSEVISIVKEKLLRSLFSKSMQRVGYIYEMDI